MRLFSGCMQLLFPQRPRGRRYARCPEGGAGAKIWPILAWVLHWPLWAQGGLPARCFFVMGGLVLGAPFEVGAGVQRGFKVTTHCHISSLLSLHGGAEQGACLNAQAAACFFCPAVFCLSVTKQARFKVVCSRRAPSFTVPSPLTVKVCVVCLQGCCN